MVRNSPQLYEKRIPADEAPPGRFFVARIIEDPHMRTVTKKFALRLGRQGLVRTHNCLHVTVGNGVMRGVLNDMGYSVKDVIDFSRGLDGMIHKKFGDHAGNLDLNRSNPLIWMGRGRQNKLGLRLSGSILEEQREAINTYFLHQTGRQVGETFEPHVSLATVNNELALELADDPNYLARGICMPKKIGARCLSVYQGHIHETSLVWGIKK